MKRRPELPPVSPDALTTMSVATIAVLLTEGRVTLGEATRELERRMPVRRQVET